MIKEIRILSKRGKQYYLTIPRDIVYRLFEEEADGRYYVRMSIEGDELRVSPLMAHPDVSESDFLEAFNRLTEQEKEE